MHVGSSASQNGISKQESVYTGIGQNLQHMISVCFFGTNPTLPGWILLSSIGCNRVFPTHLLKTPGGLLVGPALAPGFWSLH
jgi:hypothetical protein